MCVSIFVIDCKLEEKLIEVPIGNGCICPDDIVTYECTVIGNYGGFTLWMMGDFFHCSSGKQLIELAHSQLTNVQGGGASSTLICNDGNIAGRLIRVENGTFTSQLNITLTTDIVGRSIECAYDNGPGTSIRRVGSLNLTTG